MARVILDRSPLTEPPTNIIDPVRTRNNPMALPYKSHPIFQLRKRSLILCIIGVFLCIVCSGPFYGGAFLTVAVLLTFSSIFCVIDLIVYATKKLENPDDDPEWPQVKFMVGDFIFSIILQVVYWAAIGSLTYGYYGAPPIAAYALLTAFLCSLLHFWCFWKQLMARYKKKWLASLPHQPCARCGYSGSDTEPVAAQSQSNAVPPNIFAYAGPSADFRQANILTPQSPESAMEEGLLIGSDYGASYGSVEQADPVIEHSEETVVGKGKKKKAAGNNTVKDSSSKAGSSSAA